MLGQHMISTETQSAAVSIANRGDQNVAIFLMKKKCMHQFVEQFQFKRKGPNSQQNYIAPALMSLVSLSSVNSMQQRRMHHYGQNGA